MMLTMIIADYKNRGPKYSSLLSQGEDQQIDIVSDITQN